MAPRKKMVGTVYAKLASRYGMPAPTHPRGRLLDVLVETILSQHTSDANSHRAFLELRKQYPRWEQVCEADPKSIERAIRSGGLARQKSVRIQTVLRSIREREGRLSLARLKKMSTDAVYNYLTSLPGVGDKTACCVLLFALDRPVMPVDTHIHRVTKRLGWISSRATPDVARATWERALPAEHLYHAHVLLIAHGRRCCVAQRPRCPECPIRAHCAYGRHGDGKL